MKKFKRSLALMLAAVLLLGVVFAFAGCASSKDKEPQKTPQEVLQDAFQKTNEAMNGKLSAEWLDNLADITSGSISLNMGNKEANVDVSAYFDTETSKIAALSKISASGQNIDVGLYLSEKEICLDLPMLLGKPYGMKFDTMEEDLKNSLLPQMLGVTKEEFVKQIGQIQEALQEVANLPNGNNLIQEAEKLTQKVAEILKACEIKQEEKTVKIGGAEQKAIAVSYTMTSNELTQIAEQVINLLDSQLTGFIGQVTGMSADMAALESARKQLEQAKKDINEILRDSEAKATLTYYINPDNGMIMSILMTVDAKSDGVAEQLSFNVELGVDPAASEAIVIRMGVTDNGLPGSEVTVRIESAEKDGVYNGKFAIDLTDGDEKQSLSVAVTWDRSSGRYTLSLVQDDKKLVELKGAAKIDENSITFSVDSVVGEGATAETDRIELSLTKNAKVPETPEYTNIVSMSVEQWQELALRIQGLVGSAAA